MIQQTEKKQSQPCTKSSARWECLSKKFPFSGIFLSFALPQTPHIIWGNPESRKILAITVDDSANKMGNSFLPLVLLADKN